MTTAPEDNRAANRLLNRAVTEAAAMVRANRDPRPMLTTAIECADLLLRAEMVARDGERLWLGGGAS